MGFPEISASSNLSTSRDNVSREIGRTYAGMSSLSIWASADSRIRQIRVSKIMCQHPAIYDQLANANTHHVLCMYYIYIYIYICIYTYMFYSIIYHNTAYLPYSTPSEIDLGLCVGRVCRLGREISISQNWPKG